MHRTGERGLNKTGSQSVQRQGAVGGSVPCSRAGGELAPLQEPVYTPYYFGPIGTPTSDPSFPNTNSYRLRHCGTKTLLHWLGIGPGGPGENSTTEPPMLYQRVTPGGTLEICNTSG